ncbi:MAG: hypothetical protein ABMA02_12200 [Saprospiraceae bacterium]
MESVKQEFTTTNITVLPGEIVQLIGTTPDSCIIFRQDVPTKPSSLVVYPEKKVSQTRAFPTFHSDTIAVLLERWLADVPIRSFQKIIAKMGLEGAAPMLVQSADTDVCFRLNMLKAVLEGKQVIQVVSPWKVSDVTDFMLAIQEFAVDQAEQRSEDAPAFVVYDGDESTGISIVANDILVVEAGQVKRRLVLL